MSETLPFLSDTKAQRERLRTTKVLFQGSERNLCNFTRANLAGGVLGDDAELSSSGFTGEEDARATELARPFNDAYSHSLDENSMTMYADWMDKDGFIFKVDVDNCDSTIDWVHEKDLPKYLKGLDKRATFGGKKVITTA